MGDYDVVISAAERPSLAIGVRSLDEIFNTFSLHDVLVITARIDQNVLSAGTNQPDHHLQIDLRSYLRQLSVLRRKVRIDSVAQA